MTTLTTPDDAERSDNKVLGCRRPGKAWAEDAKANIANSRAKLAITMARHPMCSAPDGDAVIAEQVTCFLVKADNAAWGVEPRYRRIRSWWSGTSTEAAYKNLHYAEACLARLYSTDEIRAELADAVRRAKGALAADDPTRLAGVQALAADKRTEEPGFTREQLSLLIGLGHEAADRQRARLRGFRNVMLVSVLFACALAGGIALLGSWSPQWLPLCFTDAAPPLNASDVAVACPTGQSLRDEAPRGSTWADALLVVLLGAVGGALSSLVFIRGLYANSTPYNIAVPLAMVKVPTGALVAVIGMMLLAGDFVPGFTAVDRQPQILAYALLFGFAQQLITGMLDRRAKELIASVPSKTKDDTSPAASTAAK